MSLKISVDGGALYPENNQRFGTAVFSENLIKALKLYDKKNQYKVYTFKNLKPKLFWMKGRISIEEFKDKQDVFLALNQALPLYTSGKIISFCHGLSYYFYPQYYSKNDVKRLNNQLKEMINRSDHIIVSSQKIRDKLVSINQLIDTKIIVIPFGIPFDTKRNIKNQKSKIKNKKYFLYVGMDHPIKNINFIKKVFREFNESAHSASSGQASLASYKLIIVTKNCSRKKLRSLYQNATALLTASYYESFNFPVLEALSVGCPVIGLKSAIIPELKPFVNVVNNKEEFVKKMSDITKKPNVQLINQLYKDFNWRSYVKNLVKLYS